MKIRIETPEGVAAEIEDRHALDIDDACDLFTQALRGVGYEFSGRIVLEREPEE